LKIIISLKYRRETKRVLIFFFSIHSALKIAQVCLTAFCRDICRDRDKAIPIRAKRGLFTIWHTRTQNGCCECGLAARLSKYIY